MAEYIHGELKLTLHPLTLGDRKKIKAQSGVDIFALPTAGAELMDAVVTMCTYGIKKNNNLTDEEIDELPLVVLKGIQQLLLEGLIDRPT